MKNGFLVLGVVGFVLLSSTILTAIPNKYESTNMVTVAYECFSDNEIWYDQSKTNDLSKEESLKLFLEHNNVYYSDFEKIKNVDSCCDDLCLEDYFFRLKIYAKDLGFLEDLGFNQI